MPYKLLFIFFLGVSNALSGQTCGFSEGKNLAALHAAVYAKDPVSGPAYFLPAPFQQAQKNAPGAPLSGPFLPRWSAEKLPFFCKIEHDWAKKARIPLKFRLGSVEYVDWLEGKRY